MPLIFEYINYNYKAIKELKKLASGMDTIKKKLQYTKNMDDNRRIHAQPIYYYKATKELTKLAIQSYNKKNTIHKN